MLAKGTEAPPQEALLAWSLAMATALLVDAVSTGAARVMGAATVLPPRRGARAASTIRSESPRRASSARRAKRTQAARTHTQRPEHQKLTSHAPNLRKIFTHTIVHHTAAKIEGQCRTAFTVDQSLGSPGVCVKVCVVRRV